MYSLSLSLPSQHLPLLRTHSPNNVTFPPLDTSYSDKHPGLKLLQVQAIARHGSRVPYIKYMDCWDGYGFKWDCNVTEMSIPSPKDKGNDGMRIGRSGSSKGGNKGESLEPSSHS